MIRISLAATALTWGVLYLAVRGGLGAWDLPLDRGLVSGAPARAAIACEPVQTDASPPEPVPPSVNDDSRSVAQAPHSLDSVIAEFDVPRDGSWLIVLVEVANQKYPFLVDTGCVRTIVEPEFIARLAGSENQRRDPRLESTAPFKLADLAGAHVRGGSFGPAVCEDLTEFKRLSGLNVRGILGMSFLQDKIVSLDLDAGKLFLLRSLPASVQSSPDFSITDSTWRPTVEVALGNGRAASFLLDTGCCGQKACGVLATSAFDDLKRDGDLVAYPGRYPCITFSSIEFQRRGRVSQLQIGDFAQSQLDFSEGEINLLGLGFLQRFRVTFDFPGGRLYLEKGARYVARDADQVAATASQ